MRFSDNQGVTHHLSCSKVGQQGDGLETIHFAVTVHPSIGRVCERQGRELRLGRPAFASSSRQGATVERACAAACM